MEPIEYLQLKAEALKKFKALLDAFSSYCSSLVIDKKDFDTEKELRNFEDNSKEGLEYIAAINNLRKFERENKIYFFSCCLLKRSKLMLNFLLIDLTAPKAIHAIEPLLNV